VNSGLDKVHKMVTAARYVGNLCEQETDDTNFASTVAVNDSTYVKLESSMLSRLAINFTSGL
jgi:predicted DNA-binding ribbon-helix-helix protein